MNIRAEHHETIYETIDRGIREEIEDKFENDHDLKLKLLDKNGDKNARNKKQSL